MDAKFSYERAEGFVTYDPNLTSVENIVAELKRMTGFEATEREKVEGDPAGEATDDGERGHDSSR